MNTCVKPSYEVDDTGMWNFCKGDDIYKEDTERYERQIRYTDFYIAKYAGSFREDLNRMRQCEN